MPAPSDGGLSARDAEARLRRDGPNELPSPKRGAVAALIAIVREPMILLLAGTSAVYLVLGEPSDAITLGSLVLLVVGIGWIQQRKTQRAIDALRDLSSPRALVVRDGRSQRIAGRDVVAGDLVLIAEGDRVPADGSLVKATNLEVDESLLTGESVAVAKTTPSAGPDDDRALVHGGTLVVRGRGTFVVAATGPRTAMGRIGTSLREVDPPPTPFQREVARLVRLVAAVGIAACVAIAAVYALRRGEVVAGLLAGLTLAMSILPEEFPVVLTAFQALGGWRLSRRGVLARRIQAIEALGATTVLCSDKTGTLTANRMRIVALDDGATWEAGAAPLPRRLLAIVEYGVLASASAPTDPMEIAFHELAARELPRTTPSPALREYGLSAAVLAMTRIHRADDGSLIAATKGAPETVVRLCGLDEPRRSEVEARALALARRGMRVLAVARGVARADALPDEQSGFRLEFLGLVGLADPIREQVPGAIAECRSGGIRVVMITGDHPSTAAAIAVQAGIDSDAIATGAEIERVDDAELRERVRTTSVFARISPQQKLRLVRSLQAAGEVVAMTGDGVNDAPALKAADIGIAMGGRGSDVAREAASLVLTDDDFASLVAGLRLGRRIFDNLRKAMTYVLAVHVPIAGLSLIPVAFGEPMLLLPIHVAFLELMIDPACALAFEAQPAEPDIMRRPPHPVGAPLFARRMLATALLQGGSVLAVSLGAYALGHHHGGDDYARAMSFTSLIAGNLALILVNRSWRQSALRFAAGEWITVAICVAAGVVLSLALWIPALQRLFHFARVTAADGSIAALAGLCCLGWFEGVKRRLFRAAQGAPREGRAAGSAQ